MHRRNPPPDHSKRQPALELDYHKDRKGDFDIYRYGHVSERHVPKYKEPERPPDDDDDQELVQLQQQFSRLDYGTLASQPRVRLEPASEFPFHVDFIPFSDDNEVLEEDNTELAMLYDQQQDLNRAIQADPKCVDLYLQLADLQEKLYKAAESQQRPTRAAVIDKQLAIISKAKEFCGSDAELLIKELEILAEIRTFAEMKELWQEALELLPKSAELCLAHLDWLEFGVGLSNFKFDSYFQTMESIFENYGTSRFNFAKPQPIRHYFRDLVFKRLCRFLRETNYTELLAAILQNCVIEDDDNGVPASYLFDSAIYRAFEGRLRAPFEFRYNDGLTLVQNWVAMEKATELSYWAPAQGCRTHTDQDPDEPVEDKKRHIDYGQVKHFSCYDGGDMLFFIGLNCVDMPLAPNLPKKLFSWDDNTSCMPNAFPYHLTEIDIDHIQSFSDDRRHFVLELIKDLRHSSDPEILDFYVYVHGRPGVWIEHKLKEHQWCADKWATLYRFLRHSGENEKASQTAEQGLIHSRYDSCPILVEVATMMLAQGRPLDEISGFLLQGAEKQQPFDKIDIRSREALEQTILQAMDYRYRNGMVVTTLLIYYSLGFWNDGVDALISKFPPSSILHWAVALQLHHDPLNVAAYRRILYTALEVWPEDHILMSLAQRLDCRSFRSPLRVFVERKVESVEPDQAAKIWAQYLSLQDSPSEWLCEKILQNEKIARYPDIWGYLLSCPLSPAKRKATLYRAIAACPSHKAFYLEAIESPEFTEPEAVEIFHLLDEKGLRVRRLLEECTLYK